MPLNFIILLISVFWTAVLSSQGSSSYYEDLECSTSRTHSYGSMDKDFIVAQQEDASMRRSRKKEIDRDSPDHKKILLQRTQLSNKRAKERSMLALQRLFPDKADLDVAKKQYKYYDQVARKYGADNAKSVIQGVGDTKVLSRKKKTEAEIAEVRALNIARCNIRRRLRNVPDDPVMLARAAAIGMDLDGNGGLKPREKVDYVHRFLEVYYRYAPKVWHIFSNSGNFIV